MSFFYFFNWSRAIVIFTVSKNHLNSNTLATTSNQNRRFEKQSREGVCVGSSGLSALHRPSFPPGGSFRPWISQAGSSGGWTHGWHGAAWHRGPCALCSWSYFPGTHRRSLPQHRIPAHCHTPLSVGPMRSRVIHERQDNRGKVTNLFPSSWKSHQHGRVNKYLLDTQYVHCETVNYAPIQRRRPSHGKHTLSSLAFLHDCPTLSPELNLSGCHGGDVGKFQTDIKHLAQMTSNVASRVSTGIRLVLFWIALCRGKEGTQATGRLFPAVNYVKGTFGYCLEF